MRLLLYSHLTNQVCFFLGFFYHQLNYLATARGFLLEHEIHVKGCRTKFQLPQRTSFPAGSTFIAKCHPLLMKLLLLHHSC